MIENLTIKFYVTIIATGCSNMISDSYKIMNQVKTIADIARLAGVSKSTVSRALNDNPLISEKTRLKIQGIAEKHRFVLHKGARNLSLKQTRTFAFIAPMEHIGSDELNDPYFVELLKSIVEKATLKGYDILVSRPASKRADEIVKYIDSNRADGVIFMACGINPEMEPLIGNPGLLGVGADVPDGIPSVDCDNYMGGKLAGQHLVDQGCKSIAFIGGPEDGGETRLRYKGFRDALEENRVELKSGLATFGDYTGKAGYKRTKDLLKKETGFDGVFACSDLMAIGAIEALRENERIAGNDVAVVGFDGIPMAEYCSPPLTTIEQNIKELGAASIDGLLQHTESQIITKTVLPVQLKIRQSSGFKEKI